MAFPLVRPLSSTDSAAAFGPALFVRFFGTMGLSDSPETCMSDVQPTAFSDRSPPRFAQWALFDEDASGVLRVPLSTLHLSCYHDRRMTQGQDGSLLLSRAALSSATPCRL